MPLPSYDPAQYDAQLEEKRARFAADFAPYGLPEPEVFRSAPQGYRLRAEFRLWHDGERLDYAMYDAADPKTPLTLEAFPPAAAPIARVMPLLRERLRGNEHLRRRIFQVEFLATLSGECLVSLVYHRRLDADWESAARELAAALDIQVIGRSRGQKIVLERDWVEERFELDGRSLSYQQFEGSFTQPNGEVNRQMLGWARAQAAPLGGDLLELYCGNGNFTVALAPLFGHVLATEMSKPSVRAAERNLAANGIGNVDMVRMASEEVSAALTGVRPFKRLKDIDLTARRFSTLFVDPPRSGLDAATLALASRFDHILYISCNPQTLRENLETLSATHAIAAAAAFDQFPYTHHLECGLLLSRRSG